MVEGADDAHALGVRCPHREANARYPVDCYGVSAEETVRVVVLPAGEASQVLGLQLRCKAVRIVVLVPVAVVRLPAKSVPWRQFSASAHPLEKRRLPDPHELDGRLRERRALGVRQQCAQDNVPVADRVDAEHPPRIVQAACQQPTNVAIVQVRLQCYAPQLLQHRSRRSLPLDRRRPL